MGLSKAGGRSDCCNQVNEPTHDLSDEVFKALQEIGYCEKLVESAEATIKECEEELAVLSDLQKMEASWNPFGVSGVRTRLSNLLRELEEAEEKRVKLEGRLSKLKRVLK